MLAQRRRSTFALMALIFVAINVIIVDWYIVPAYIRQEIERGRTTLQLSMASMLRDVQQYEKLPELFAADALLRSAVQHPEDADIVHQANLALFRANNMLRSSDIYVLDRAGVTIAASNFTQERSFVGEDFAFRPYFHDAIAGGRGSYFALGATSMKRGHYFSSPIWAEDAIIGVVVFKVDVEDIEEAWSGTDHETVVTDDNGIIFMSSREDWLYKSLRVLDPAVASAVEQSRQYLGAAIVPLPVDWSGSQERPVVAVHNPQGTDRYVHISAPTETGWEVHVLTSTSGAIGQMALPTLALVLAEIVGIGALFVLNGRRVRFAQQMARQQQAKEDLEARVRERTTDLYRAKTVLEKEVRERMATEQELRRTQSDLVQAGKLAALGRMSATLSHELSQPLTTIRTLSENAMVLLDLKRGEEALANIRRILAMADRMAEISRQLRHFARKPGKGRSVLIASALNDALDIMGTRLEDAGVQLVTRVSADMAVTAGVVRLSQVFVNIVGNAVNAVQASENKVITVSARRDGAMVEISVCDTGGGIAPEQLKRIFDPFYTTKSSRGSGGGMGLGLSISYNIVKDFGGYLTAGNHAGGGAEFRILLPAARPARAPKLEAMYS